MRKNTCFVCQSALPAEVNYCKKCSVTNTPNDHLFVENTQADNQLKKIYSFVKTKQSNVAIANLLNKEGLINLHTQAAWASAEIEEVTKTFRMRSATPLFLQHKEGITHVKNDRKNPGFLTGLGLCIGVFLLILIMSDDKAPALSELESSNGTRTNEVAMIGRSPDAIESQSLSSPVSSDGALALKESRLTNRVKVLEPSKINIEDNKRPLLVTSDKKVTKQAIVNHYPQKPMYVDAARLNVRNEPNKKGKVVWTLKRDQEVQVTNKDGNWLYIENSRFTGWVYGTYLTNAPTPKTAVVPVKQKKVAAGPTTAQIKKILIDRSHAYYSGSCPCPYNTTSRGRSCGKRSAYSRPGGASPLCYNRDVTAQMVAAYKARQR